MSKRLIRYVTDPKVDEKIKAITTSSIGKIEKKESYELIISDSVDEIYSYEDWPLRLVYSRSGFPSKYSNTFIQEYCVFFYGELVYRSSNKDNAYVHSNKKWHANLDFAYTKYLDAAKALEDARNLKKYRANRDEEIRKIFRLVYLEYPTKEYSDSRINIFDIEEKVSSYNSSVDGHIIDRTYLGRITLCDGTIVYDSYDRIHRPGMWEDYVIDLANRIQNIRDERQRQLVAREREERARQKLLKKKSYEFVYTPIDDSRYFK